MTGRVTDEAKQFAAAGPTSDAAFESAPGPKRGGKNGSNLNKVDRSSELFYNPSS
jgi:hypothetical protein